MVQRGRPGPGHTQGPPHPQALVAGAGGSQAGGLASLGLRFLPSLQGPCLLPLCRLPARSWKEPVQLLGQEGPSFVQPLSSRPQAEC